MSKTYEYELQVNDGQEVYLATVKDLQLALEQNGVEKLPADERIAMLATAVRRVLKCADSGNYDRLRADSGYPPYKNCSCDWCSICSARKALNEYEKKHLQSASDPSKGEG